MLNESNIPLEEDGIEEEILVDEEVAITKAMWGDVGGNIENQTDLQNALDAKQDSLTEAQLNAVNSGITSEKVTTYDGYADQIASKADQSALNAESTARGEADTALGTRIDNEALARQQTDNGLQSQIDAITSKSDVVDVVANYAALQAYDTSTLGNNDVVKVLDDETHEDALTYYRWSTTTQTWSYIGQEAPYYSKGQMDAKLAEKQDKLTAGANIQIQNGTISATDTTYTAGNGLNLNDTEFSADTDVLATKEDLEGYYTKSEADNLLAPKLEAEMVAELPTTGEEGKLYLTPKAHTTSTATGNPIEATVTEQAGQLESFQLDGDTFQQSYNGSNLIDMPIVNGSRNGVTWVVNDDGSITLNGTATANVGIRAEGARIPAVAGEMYTLSATGLQGIVNFGYKNSGSGADVFIVTPGSPVNTVQVTEEMLASANRLDMFFTTGASFNNQRVTLQLEKGSTATDYEPYVGGQAIPSPDYPQPIQTVTGTQTISINGTDYPINLGDIQLCGLGDDGNGNPLYRDCIYPDGDDWKVHKAVGKYQIDGSENWIRQTATDIYYRATDISVPSTTIGYCNYLRVQQAGTTIFALPNCIRFSGFATDAFISPSSTFADAGAFTTWLGQVKPIVYYPLATATDTTITDTALIAQLEAIRTASLENGTNTITNTATGSNLAGDMEIGYYGFNPTNRYDKFIWLDLNNNYEQIGGE